MSIEINSYAQARELFSKARNKDRGKPVLSFARLMAGEGETLRLIVHGAQVCLIKPGNTVEFTMNINQAKSMSNSLSMGLYTLLGVHWMRVDTRRYKLLHDAKTKKLNTRSGSQYYDWIDARASGQEYFQGLTIDLTTGEVVNPRPDMTSTFDPAKRKAWLDARKKFMRHIKTLDKLGVLESIAKSKNSKHLWEYRVDWFDETVLDTFANHLKAGEYPHDLLDQIVGHVLYSSYGKMDNDFAHCIKTHVLDRYSIELRERFGVFGETPDERV